MAWGSWHQCKGIWCPHCNWTSSSSPSIPLPVATITYYRIHQLLLLPLPHSLLGSGLCVCRFHSPGQHYIQDIKVAMVIGPPKVQEWESWVLGLASYSCSRGGCLFTQSHAVTPQCVMWLPVQWLIDIIIVTLSR